MAGEMFYLGETYSKFGLSSLVIIRQLSVNEIASTSLPLRGTDINGWNHIAVTCENENTVKVFINGEYRISATSLGHLNDTSQGIINVITRPPKKMYRIGHFLVDGPSDNQLFGSVMDLHILGFALSSDKISDLYKG